MLARTSDGPGEALEEPTQGEQRQRLLGSIIQDVEVRPGFLANGFATLEQARDWVLAFVRWYNTEHRHSALHYVTPVQRHNGDAEMILARRKRIIEAEKARHPLRWSGQTRNLSLPESVTLNPDRAVDY